MKAFGLTNKMSPMNSHATAKSDGFSLVELIASLTIAGILAVALMTIVVIAFNGFSLSRDAAGVTQKANLAISRMRVELLNVTSITTAQANQIIYKTDNGTYEILRTGNVITLEKTDAASPIPPKILMDNILANYGADSFLTYEKRDASPWTPSDDISELYGITLLLKFSTVSRSIGTMINPRNNRVRNAPLLVYQTKGSRIQGFEGSRERNSNMNLADRDTSPSCRIPDQVGDKLDKPAPAIG
jgi:prepilin-type N-terminal cleavage/methylation domain-containing protein